MKSNKLELDAVEKVATETADRSMRELEDLQLSLVGGGIADPILH